MKKEVTEETRKENQKFFNNYMSVVTGLTSAYAFSLVGSIMGEYQLDMFDALGYLIENKIFFPIGFNLYTVLGIANGVLAGGIYHFMESVHGERTYAYKKDEVAGSARFMTKKEMENYRKKYLNGNNTDISKPFDSMIMSQNFGRPIKASRLIGNNNVVVIGAAGTGKSRFFIKPNILQMNASYVITDPSGEMIYSLGNALNEFGYKIKIFNISDMTHSNCYNPLEYIRDEAGVNMLIECFIKNTTKDGSKGDEFFTNAEKLLYSACIFYLWENCDDESRKNFGSIINMVNSSAVDENNPNAKSPLDELFDQLPKDCLAWKYYKAFKQAAGKTLKSIIISCVTRLQPFLTPQVANLTKTDDMELDKLGEELTALFIITPQADRTYSFLASMLYSQLFETLYYKGEQKKLETGSESLKIPVRCLMDEFANIGEVPDFPSKLATMRKYNISASIILQDISQIESMYPDDWKTLVGNCSSIVFLGSAEPNTLKYFSDMLGKGTVVDRGRGSSQGKSGSSSQNYKNQSRELRFADELGRMPADECIIFTQNMRPVSDKKYDYVKHSRYELTADADDDLGYVYTDIPEYDNQKLTNINSLLKAKSERARLNKQKMVTSPKASSEAYVEEEKEEAMDKLTVDENQEKVSYLEWSVNSLEQLKENPKLPISFSKIEHVSLARTIRIAKENKALIDHPVIVFTDINNDNEELIGIAIASDKKEKFKYVIQNKVVKDFTFEKDFTVIKISKHRLDEYKDLVIKKYSDAE